MGGVSTLKFIRKSLMAQELFLGGIQRTFL